jgi:hypothetical protein
VIPADIRGRPRKKALRSLGIIDEHEGLSQQVQDVYAKLFGQPLLDSHLHALTVLFNWSIPKELDPSGDDVLVV